MGQKLLFAFVIILLLFAGCAQPPAETPSSEPIETPSPTETPVLTETSPPTVTPAANAFSKRSSSAIAVTPNGRWVLAVNPDSNSVSLIDTNTGTLAAEIPTGQEPRSVAVNRNGTTAYVACMRSDSVSVVDIDQRPIVVYPYQTGDVLWVTDTNNSIIAEITVSDTEGSLAGLVLSRSYQSHNPSNHFSGLEIPERVSIGEIPLFNTTPTGLDAALFPESVDQWGYFYLSAQRPGISVRAYIGQAWFLRTYWATDYKYDRQLGHGLQGDLNKDVKLQFGGAVVRLLGDLDDPSDDRNEYLGYASTEILIPMGDEQGIHVFPPFQGAAGGPDGGPLLNLKGKDIDLFITPTGVQPGTVLEVGNTFSFSGTMWPNLASKASVTVTAPSGTRHVIQGQANK